MTVSRELDVWYLVILQSLILIGARTSSSLSAIGATLHLLWHTGLAPRPTRARRSASDFSRSQPQYAIALTEYRLLFV